jgi:hypothetical protein
MELYYTASTVALQLQVVRQRTVQEETYNGNGALTQHLHILYDALLLTSNTPIYKICIYFTVTDENIFSYKNITLLQVFANYGTAQPISYNFIDEDSYKYLPSAGLIV